MSEVVDDRGLIADLVIRSLYNYAQMEAAIARLRAAVTGVDVTAMLEKIRHDSKGDPALVISQLTSIGYYLGSPGLCLSVGEPWRVVRPETIRRCAKLTLTTSRQSC